VFIEHPGCRDPRFCEWDPHFLTIQGAGAGLTLIQGTVDILGVRVTLADITVQGAIDCALRVQGIYHDCDDCQELPPNYVGFIDLRRSTIEGNECGVEMEFFSDTTITGTTIRDNNGNGIQGQGPLTVNRSTISGNGGDGIQLLYRPPVEVDRSTISGNGGDGIHILSFEELSPFVAITQTTINGNSGSGLWGIARYLSYEYPLSFPVKSTIVSDNSGGDCGGLLEVDSQGVNLSSDDTCALQHSTDLMSTSPLLLPLADNGGPTLTHALAPGSPAIDAAGDNCEPIDQRGAPRPVDGDGDGAAKCDIGAFEYLPPETLISLLIDRVESLGFSRGTENSLVAKLNVVLRVLQDVVEGNDHAAIHTLGAFINAVEAQHGKKIAAADADALVAAAERIIGLL